MSVEDGTPDIAPSLSRTMKAVPIKETVAKAIAAHESTAHRSPVEPVEVRSDRPDPLADGSDLIGEDVEPRLDGWGVEIGFRLRFGNGRVDSLAKGHGAAPRFKGLVTSLTLRLGCDSEVVPAGGLGSGDTAPRPWSAHTLGASA